MNPSGNTILITGGTSGIGFEMAKQFLAMNNTVIVCSRNPAKLQDTKTLLPGVHAHQCDLSDEHDRLSLYDTLSTQLDINILINNAAITHTSDFMDNPHAYDECLSEIHTNLIAPIHLTKLFLPQLQNRPNAHIINISTGLIYAPKVAYPCYTATKSALHAFSQVIRCQLKDKPITITEVLFPVVDTPWYHGNTPKVAISPKQAVDEMIQGLLNHKTQINVGKVGLLYAIYRLSPALAFKIMNKMNERDKMTQ